MTTNDEREVLSALLDREPVDPDVLARLLDEADNRRLLVDFVRLRAWMHEPAADAELAPPSERTALPRMMARAAAAMALIGAGLAGGAWLTRADADVAPEPTRVVKLLPVGSQPEPR